MLFMSIRLSEGHQGLSRCIVGHPTRVNVTCLSRGNHFHRSIKRAYNCKHSRGRSLLLSPRWLHLGAKNISLPSVLRYRLSENLLYVYNIVLQLGEFLAPPFLKITNCLVLSIIISINSQLNCHSDKWPIIGPTLQCHLCCNFNEYSPNYCYGAA